MGKFIDKKNYDEVYLRNVIVGFLGFLKDKFNYTQYSEEHGMKKVNVPVGYSLTGQKRYILDAFYDDVPNLRINGNTDSIPAAYIKLNSWNIKNEEFTNPNVWVDVTKELGEDIIEFATQLKAVPIKLNFSLELVIDNEIDVFKVWESYMRTIWIYKYFNFSYHRIPIQAVFNFVGDTDNQFVRDSTFGESNEMVKVEYPFEVHTFFPLFDINRNDITEFNIESRYALGSVVLFDNVFYVATCNIDENGLLPTDEDSCWEETDIDSNIAMMSNKRVTYILDMWQKTQ